MPIDRQHSKLDSAKNKASHTIADPTLLAIAEAVGKNDFLDGKFPGSMSIYTCCLQDNEAQQQ